MIQGGKEGKREKREGRRKGGRWAGKRTEGRNEKTRRKSMYYIFICKFNMIYLSIIYKIHVVEIHD